jgi:two-component system, sensor histidine kinase YesM
MCMTNIKRKLFKNELRKAFILYALVPIILLSFLFYNLLFYFSKKTVENHNEKYNKSIASSIEKEFNSYKNEVQDLANRLEIKKVFYSSYDETEIYEIFYNVVNNHNIRSLFYVYNEKGEVLITNSKVIPQYSKSDDLFMWGIFKKMKDYPKETAMMLNRAQIDVNTRTVYSIGHAIVDANLNIIGYISFDILENQLNKMINTNTTHHAVITDRYNNNIVSSNNGLLDTIGKLRPPSGEDKSYVLSTPILSENVYIHTITSLGYINNIYLIGEVFLIAIFFIIFLTMSVIANKVAISKTKAIDELLEAIISVQEGNLNTVVNINTNDEFELIGQHYNEMVVKINELIEKNKEEAKRSVLSEIKQLEAQFNPHFLFNTLEMLKYMIKIDKENSLKVIVSMSNLLRYSINSDFHSVKLIDDIKYIEDYLTIQKFRFDKNFDYNIYLEEDTKNCIIPKLIIQPIIENSIKYGYETKNYLKVDIKCSIKDKDLIIYISDNGEGMSDEKYRELIELIYNNENNTNHIGLYNVQKRINLIYGMEYGMEIFSTINEGTRIIIKLPIHRGEV